MADLVSKAQVTQKGGQDSAVPVSDGSDQQQRNSNMRIITKRDIDDTTLFYNTHKDSVKPLDDEHASRVTRKNFWCLLGQTWWISFLIHLDEGTIGKASVMGLFDDVQMSKSEFNNTFVVYYTGYLVALWPGAMIAQRVGQKNFITASLLIWAFLLGMHPLVRTGKQLLGLRFLLGLASSQIIPSTTVLHQAFFPPKKSPWVQLLWWSAGSFASVLLSLVSYRLIEDDNAGSLVGGIKSWKWLHIICVVITFIIAAVLIVFLPDSPVNAKWLTTDEKIHTIGIIRETHAGISNSTFKWDQVKECFTDVKSWLFIIHMFLNELPNNTSHQLPLIIVGFGFTPAQSALFNIAKPLWGAFMVCVSAALVYSTDLGVGYTCALSYIPCVIGGIMMLASPWSNKIALVIGTQISTFKPSYLLGLSWAGTTTIGYTKKLWLMSSCVVAAAVANMISPEFWQEKYAPRYYLPWSFMTAFWALSLGMCLTIRFYLDHQNKVRAKILEQEDSDNEGALDTGDGILCLSEKDLDQTDRKNLRFVYPL